MSYEMVMVIFSSESYLLMGCVMAGLFAKAALKAKSTEKASTKKQTLWLTNNAESEVVGQAIHDLVLLEADAKAIEAKMGVKKTIVKNYAESRFLTQYAGAGVFPETPMVLQNDAGEKVTYVVQDRSAQYQVKEDQQEALSDLLGEDAARDLLFEETSFSFKRDVLALPGVQKVVEAALEAAVKKLTSGNEPVLTNEQAGELLSVNIKTAFKPGTMDRLSLICGRDTMRMKQFLEIAGSSCTRYIKT